MAVIVHHLEESRSQRILWMLEELALDYEIGRQIALVESGGRVIQETRLYNPDLGETIGMRSKEHAHDYRYFPDPDLLPLVLDPALIERVRASLGERGQVGAISRARGQPDVDGRAQRAGPADLVGRAVLGHRHVGGQGRAAEDPQVDVGDHVVGDTGAGGDGAGRLDLTGVALAVAEAQRVG